MSNFTPQQIEEFLQEFFDVVGARQYVGARYVPIFGRAGEDTVEWDDGAPYEPLTVVMHEGVSYVSRRYVPAGIQIGNTDYWVQTYRFNAQVEQYRQEVLGFADDIADRVPFPDGDFYPRYGTMGQVLTTLADGSTMWNDPVTPSDEQAEAVITQWLDDHPEATTTVEDNSLTTAKYQNGSVTDQKLDPDGVVKKAAQTELVLPSKEPLDKRNILGAPSAWASYPTRTDHGITYTVVGDSVLINGTATASSFFYYLNGTPPAWAKSGNQYEVIFAPSDENVKIDIRSDAGSGIAVSYMSNKGGVFNTSTVTTTFIVRIFVPNGTTVNNAVVTTAIREHENSQITDRVNSLDGNVPYVAELGTITMTNSTWIYSDSTARIRVRQAETLTLKKGDVIDIGSGVRCYLGYIDSEKNYNTINWKTGKATIPEDGEYTFIGEYTDQHQITDIDDIVSKITITRPSALYDTQNVNIAVNPMRFKPYYDHLFIQSNTGGDFIIGHNSLPSIEISKRLGFDIIEVSAARTSDDHYVCMHTTNGYIPRQFISLDDTDVSTIQPSTKPLSWFTENLRYNSTYPKYRTAPPTLEEFLAEVKSNGLIPFISSNLDGLHLDLVDEMFGKGNYIAYGMSREVTGAVIYQYKALTTVDDILQYCRQFMPPFIYGMANPESFTDAELSIIAKALHKEGYLISCADIYHTEDINLKCRLAGFDCYGSGWSVNPFDSGNVYNLSSNNDFGDFAFQGTPVIADGIATLDQYEAIKNPTPVDTTCFLGKAMLGVRFSGSVRVTLGKYISTSYGGNAIASDGTKMLWFSTMFMNAPLDFNVSARENDVKIYDIVYRASKC